MSMVPPSKFMIKFCHFFTKNKFDEVFVRNADKIEENDKTFVVTAHSWGVELVSEYRKSELTEAQIELLRDPPEKKPSGIILCGRFRHPSHPCKCSPKALPGGASA